MRLFFFCMIYLISVNAFANTYYCQSTAQYIRVGDDQSTVATRCGQPTSQSTQEQTVTKKAEVLQWIFPFPTTLTSKERPTMVVTFESDKVISITLAGVNVDSSSVCGNNKMIRKGDTTNQVRAACANPGFTNVGEREIVVGTKQITTWTYDNGPYLPPTNYEFENGKLIGKR